MSRINSGLKLFICLLASVHAELPFHKFRAASLDSAPIKQSYQDDSILIGQARFFDGYDSVLLELQDPASQDGCNVHLYKNGRLRGCFLDSNGFGSLTMASQLRYADLNADHVVDIVVEFFSSGCGLAGERTEKSYIISDDSLFHYVSFYSFFAAENRDIDGDGRYEVIVQDYLAYQGHSYWVYDAYEWGMHGLRQAAKKPLGYPFLVQYLNRPNEKLTSRVPRSQWSSFSRATPDAYRESQ